MIFAVEFPGICSGIPWDIVLVVRIIPYLAFTCLLKGDLPLLSMYSIEL